MEPGDLEVAAGEVDVDVDETVVHRVPGLIDTNILRATPNHSGGPQPTDPDALAAAPKSGMFRLMPATSVAECVWTAYYGDKIHYYVPPEIAWIDRIKAFAPRFVRARIKKEVLKVFGKD